MRIFPRLRQQLYIDRPLLGGLLLLLLAGMVILYSGADQNIGVVYRQLGRLSIALCLMLLLAQIPIRTYRAWAPWLYFGSLFLLFVVLIIGTRGKGAQRWLNLGVIQLQPAEFMKLAMPMLLAWYFHDRPLPPRFKDLLFSGFALLLPTALVAKQPDLGTAIMIAASGATVMVLAGLSTRLMLGLLSLFLVCLPLFWHHLHPYQQARVLTFLNPERDPLGSGYHIIQSKIALGSGGLYGQGWLQGMQAHLNFLPEHATDFIFAVCGEEFGLLGSVALILIYLLIVCRCLVISLQAQDTFSRLLAGALGLSFFLEFFVNTGMVVGILPVVGIPLPLVSYGGTSMLTLLASFGILMSIQTHRRLLAH